MEESDKESFALLQFVRESHKLAHIVIIILYMLGKLSGFFLSSADIFQHYIFFKNNQE